MKYPPSLDQLIGWPKDQLIDSSPFTAWESVFNKDISKKLQDKITVDEIFTQSLSEFAELNSWKYEKVNNEVMATKSLNSGLQSWMPMLPVRMATHVLSNIVISSLNCRIFTSESFSPKSGERANNMSAGEQSLVLEISLPKIFPHLLLDSHKNDRRRLSSINRAYETSQKLSLEGNFDKYFDFYAPSGLQVNALVILAPNAMQILMNTLVPYDIEFLYDKIYVFTDVPAYNRKNFEELFLAANELVIYIERLLNSWDYKPSLDTPHILRQKRISGAELKFGNKSVPYAGIMFGLGLVAAFSIIFKLSTLALFSFVLLIFGGVVWNHKHK